jgi:protein tyrosine/serine phosphatase
MTEQTIDRRIPLTGSFNFRDFGGLRTAEGRTVRSGRLFRSDELHRLTPEDVETLTGFGIRNLLDLRSHPEVASRRAELLFARGVGHRHLPMSDDVKIDPERLKAMATASLGEIYARYLDARREMIGTVFGVLAEESTYPAIVHCAGGKDRTGVISAFVLRVLGVPDEEIIADYALTDAAMPRMIAALRQETGEAFLEYPPQVLRAVPETMRGFLSLLDEKFGSADNYLAEAGVSASMLEQVRNLLLEPR